MEDLGNNVYQKENLLGRKANNFTCETTFNAHLIERKQFNLNGLFNREPSIGQVTLNPPPTVDWWVFNQLHKLIKSGNFKDLGSKKHNNLN